MWTFVSPHFDDVVWSCGGVVASLIRRGEPVRILTVCAARPKAPLTPFAAYLHAVWGLGADPVGARRDEDRAAVAVLGAEPVWLEELDAIYRHPAYASPAALTLAPRDDDHLAERVAAACGATTGTLVFPLGVGGHVDHRACCQAGLAVLRSGARVAFYAELPYALAPRALEQRLTVLGLALAPEVLDGAADIALKLDAAVCYASQIDAMFGAVATARQRLGGDERLFWPQE